MIQTFDNYSLLKHNTFGLAVKTAHFIEYDTAEELQELILRKEIITPYLHIGQGSNLLFVDDYPGTILHSRIKSIEIIKETSDKVWVKAGSGIVWDDFVAYCVLNNWYGVENLSNIPGEVGASAVQNIGAYGVEVKDIIHSVFTVDSTGQEKIYLWDDCNFGYRYSIFKEQEMKEVFVTNVCFCLSKTASYSLDYGMLRQELQKFPEISLKTVRQAVIDIRASKLPDPAVLGNAGSFFMNPVVDKKKLEELQTTYPEIPFYDLGKGKIMGPAKVHDKQALVLVNTGGATGKDIINLSNAVKESVKVLFDIEIKPEVKFIRSVF